MVVNRHRIGSLVTCLILCGILANAPNDSNCQGCVRSEVLLSRVCLELSGLELTSLGFCCAGYCVWLWVPMLRYCPGNIGEFLLLWMVFKALLWRCPD